MSSAGSYGAGGGGGVGSVKFLEGNSGGAVGPTLAGIINVVGAGDITVVGDALTNTLTVELTVDVVNSIEGDAAGSIPISGDLDITGGSSGAQFLTSGVTITESFNFLAMADTTPTTGYIKIGSSVMLAAWGGVANSNTFVGESSGNSAVSGSTNTAIGSTSLVGLTSGTLNCAVGSGTLSHLTSGNTNTGIGTASLFDATTAVANSALGYESLENLLTGSHNIAIGYQAAQNYTGAESSNITIGNSGTAAESNIIRIGTQGSGTGQQNTAYMAGIYGSSVGGTNALVFADNTGKLGTTGGTFSAVTSITGDTGSAISGALNLTGGSSGALFNTTGSNITESFHFLAMSDSTATTGYIQIGSTRVFNCGAGVAGHNTFVGQNAGNSTLSGTQNVCIGDGPGASGAGAVLTSGSLNTSCGYGSFNNLGSGFQNTAFGGTALENVTTGHNNTACGQGALFDITTGSNNTGFGYGAGSSYSVGTEANNLCVGANVSGVTGESNTIRLGDTTSATACYVAGSYGQSVGGTNAALFIDNAGKLGTVGGSGGGVSSLNTLTGALTLTGGTSGAIFTNSGGNTITESFNFLLMADTSATTGYISLGGTIVLQAGGGVANNNIFVGEAAGNTTLSGTGNVGAGASTLVALTSGSNNIAVGRLSLTAATSGAGNVGVGHETLQHATTTGQNVAVGYQALQQITTGSGENVSLGAQTMSFLGTGTANVAIGFQSGFNYSGAESNNILVSNQGVASESGSIRIGTNATHTTCFVQGIAGVTVANSAAVLINTANGQLGTVPSSRRFKENIHDMGAASRDIYKLQPVKFNFKGDFSESYGLIAEDVEEFMPHLVSYDKEGLPATVKYHELPVFLLNEIQRLKFKIDELEGKLNARVR